jgi:hypothetical protein
MKTKLIIMMLTVVCALNACTGDHNPQAGKDQKNTYGVAKDTAKTDSTQTHKETSDDHSASGGSDLVKKDTSKK